MVVHPWMQTARLDVSEIVLDAIGLLVDQDGVAGIRSHRGRPKQGGVPRQGARSSVHRELDDLGHRASWE
jgi:hypothetical protein